MSDRSVMIRVAEATKLRLQAMARQIVESVEANRRNDVEVDPEPINPAGCGLSLDACINLLLDQRDAHHERARRQAEKRRAYKDPLPAELLGDQGDVAELAGDVTPGCP